MISHFLRASLFTFYLLRSFSLQLCNTGLTIQSSHGFKIVRECLAGLISAVSYSCTQVRRATTLLASIAFTTKRRFLAPRFALSCYRLNHIIYICRKYIHLKYSISPWLLYPCDYNTTTYPCHCLATVRKMTGRPGQTRPLTWTNVALSWEKICKLIFFQIPFGIWWHWVSRGHYLLVLGGTGSVLGGTD